MYAPLTHLRRSAPQIKIQHGDSDQDASDKENVYARDVEGNNARELSKDFEIADLRKGFDRKNLSMDPLLTMHFEEVERLESTSESEPVDDDLHYMPEASPKRVIKRTTRLHSIRDSRGNKYLNQYIVMKDLGKGTYGKVKLCLSTEDSQLYAIKVIDKVLLKRRSIGRSSQMMEGIMREIAILKKMNHPNIVALYEVIDDKSHNKLYMVLEYVQGGPIIPFSTEKFSPLAESVAWLYFRDICKGLDYLHYHKVIHRDLKPENLLRAVDGTVKISDFGVSDVFDKTDLSSRTAGTPAFLAPEACSAGQFRGRGVDIWALGVCLFVMTFGCIPFQAGSVHEMYDRIRNDPLVFPDFSEASDELKDLLRRILTKDPAYRISLPAVMVHPWVTRGGQIPLPSLIVNGATPLTAQVSDYEVSHAVTETGLMHLFDPVFTERVYEPGEYLIRQGEEGEDMFFINSGECEILLRLSHGVDDDFDERQRLSSTVPSRSPSTAFLELLQHSSSHSSSRMDIDSGKSSTEPVVGEQASEEEGVDPKEVNERILQKVGPGTESSAEVPWKQSVDVSEDVGGERHGIDYSTGVSSNRWDAGAEWGERDAPEETVIARRLPGQFVGEMAVLGKSSGPSARSASVRAKTQTRVLVVSKAEVNKILANNKGAAEVIRNEIQRRHRETTEALAWARVSTGSHGSHRPSTDAPQSPLGGSVRAHGWNNGRRKPLQGREEEALSQSEDERLSISSSSKRSSGHILGGERTADPLSLSRMSPNTSVSDFSLLVQGGGGGSSVLSSGSSARFWEKSYTTVRRSPEGLVAGEREQQEIISPRSLQSMQRDLSFSPPTSTKEKECERDAAADEGLY